MNCCEYRSMLDDALDKSIKGAIEHSVRLHLDHCEGCRNHYERRRQEHIALFNALNKAYSGAHLSDGFKVGIKKEIERTLALNKRSRFSRLPHWMRIAAALVAMVSLAGFAAAVLMVSVGGPRGEVASSISSSSCDADVPLQVEDVLGTNARPEMDEIDEASVSTQSTSNEKENQNMNTRRKITAVMATAALAAASPNLARTANGETYTSASYVQDGLVAQWDGINNVGTGTHDSGSTVWKDLKGSCDMTLLSKGSWANGNALAVTGFGASGNGAAPAYRTIEVVYKMTDKNGRILFTSGHAAANNKLSQMVGFSIISGNNLAGFFDGTGTAATRYVRVNFDASAICSMSAIYEDGAVLETYGNGVVDMYQKLDTNWGISDGKVAVGARNSADTYTWTGEVFAIRLYSTALTKEQIAANLAVDAARFGVYEYKYLVSGDPIASAVARSCTTAEATPFHAIEARYRTHEWSDGVALDATELHLGTMLIVQ